MDNEFKQHKEDQTDLFFQFFMSCQKNLYAFILASVHNYNDADDILQDTAAVMWRKFDEFDKDTSFVAWGVSISKNLIKKYYSERKRMRVQFDAVLTQKISERMEKSVDQFASRQESLKICSKKLNDVGRAMIDMRYSKGMTIKAIANHLNRSVHGMYKAMARLQDSLQECIKKELLKREA